MRHLGPIATGIFLLLSGAGGPLPQPATAQASFYDDFMKLDLDQRRERFVSLNAEHRSLVVRTHAERWLVANRARLTADEVGLFEELIAFVTPERYQRTQSAPDREEQALREKLRCRVNPDDVMSAFGVLRQAPESRPERWTYLDRARCWVLVVAEEFAAFVPLVRR